MDPTAFMREVERGKTPALALVHGADAQLMDDLLAAVSRALFPDPGHAAFDREILDGREVSVEQLVSAALTLPFGAAARLVAVRSSRDFACCWRAISRAWRKQVSASACFSAESASSNSPLSRYSSAS